VQQYLCWRQRRGLGLGLGLGLGAAVPVLESNVKGMSPADCEQPPRDVCWYERSVLRSQHGTSIIPRDKTADVCKTHNDVPPTPCWPIAACGEVCVVVVVMSGATTSRKGRGSRLVSAGMWRQLLCWCAQLSSWCWREAYNYHFFEDRVQSKIHGRFVVVGLRASSCMVCVRCATG
jgi:hypothetical protein